MMPTRKLSINPSLHSIGLAIVVLIVAVGAVATPMAAQPSTSLDTCPSRQPILRIAIVSGGEAYSSHPAETRFSSTHFTRLHQMPLIGADPKEEGVDAAYGVAESWRFLPGATGMIIKIHDGLTFNDGTPITAEDVVFSLSLSASRFADPQISGTLNGIGISAKAIDSKTVQIDFAKGSPTFDIEISTMVFPVYVTSKAYHSGGEISQAAFDRFRAKPLAAGPYRVVARQAKESITLVADRRDPLLGCPVYDRIEIREVLETGTRMNQFRTGQFDLVSGSRDLLDQAKSVGGTVFYKPDGNMVGLYFFQTDRADNVFHSEDLRKAAAYAIDHKLIAEAIWNGVGVTPWGCSWPPSTEISTRNPRFVKACGTPYPYNPAKAREHMAAAGYPPGKGPTIRLEYNVSYPEEGALAEAMQQMLNAVGFNATVARVVITERERRRAAGEHINSILFFGSGGRLTSLSGAYSVYGPDQNWGPKHDKDVIRALKRASEADSVDEYTEAMSDLAELVHGRAYGPGFFSAGSVWFVRKGIPDWGLEQSKGRGPLNLAALATRP
jgi:peptide/nickel transport system substrate-binding protein